MPNPLERPKWFSLSRVGRCTPRIRQVSACGIPCWWEIYPYSCCSRRPSSNPRSSTRNTLISSGCRNSARKCCPPIKTSTIWRWFSREKAPSISPPGPISATGVTGPSGTLGGNPWPSSSGKQDCSDLNYLALVLEGEGTIYFTTRPDLRDWSDWTKRDTWGEPVAKFVRKAGLFQSADGGMTGGMTNTAQLVSSHTFAIFGKSFNFADLIPHGMTCFETGVGDENGEAEAGTCTAIGGTP